eukprot:5251910-Heterocapsa_arctica.AAC.1
MSNSFVELLSSEVTGTVVSDLVGASQQTLLRWGPPPPAYPVGYAGTPCYPGLSRSHSPRRVQVRGQVDTRVVLPELDHSVRSRQIHSAPGSPGPFCAELLLQ